MWIDSVTLSDGKLRDNARTRADLGGQQTPVPFGCGAQIR
jgi:hypothetical protein